VTILRDSFAWDWRRPSAELTDHLPPVSDALANVLPDGFKTEICPTAADWWRCAASKLRMGKLMTIDYGLWADERFLPQRAPGTLRALTKHHLGDDVLANPGGQDLTAHVNFSPLVDAGLNAGLKTSMLAPQSKFLTNIVAQINLAPALFEPWDERRTRQFQTLAHPEHLGHKFRVLIQTRQ
jgi:SAM-dependent MidA family methyltransferase